MEAFQSPAIGDQAGQMHLTSTIVHVSHRYRTCLASGIYCAQAWGSVQLRCRAVRQDRNTQWREKARYSCCRGNWTRQFVTLLRRERYMCSVPTRLGRKRVQPPTVIDSRRKLSQSLGGVMITAGLSWTRFQSSSDHVSCANFD